MLLNKRNIKNNFLIKNTNEKYSKVKYFNIPGVK